MSPENIQKVHDVLAGDDLCVGMSTEDTKRPIILRSSGGNLAVTVEIGNTLATALAKTWGEGDLVVRGLRAIIQLVSSASPSPLPALSERVEGEGCREDLGIGQREMDHG